MPTLTATGLVGRVVWLGIVPSREAALASEPQDRLSVSFAGPEGEDRGGVTRLSCSRVAALYPRGTTIRNVRQFSILSSEELADIAARMGVSALDPAWLGTTMVIQGIPDLTHLPPSSRLQFAGGATLTVDTENLPCHLPAAVIDAEFPGAGRRFKAAAAERRGITAWAEREGTVIGGEEVRLFVPRQRAWLGPLSGQRESGRQREHETTDEAGMDEKAGGGHDTSPFPAISGLPPST